MRPFLPILTVALALLTQVIAEIGEKDFIPSYQCSFCLASIDKAVDDKISPNNACEVLFGTTICGKLSLPNDVVGKVQDSHGTCAALQKCSKDSFVASSTDNGADIRVTRAIGSKGYDKVRVSVVSNATISSPMFDYSAQFKYRWTDKYLSSGIVSVAPGTTTHLTVAGTGVDIYLPKEGAGVRGVIIADPCFTSEYILCLYKDTFSMLNHTTELMNAIFTKDDVHYWQILGDNFYDQAGAISSQWTSSLQSTTKSKFFSTVPGNHDFWINANPKIYVPKRDQLGNGFMQFYGQDVIASITSSTPYDFSADPDGPNKGSENLPPASNYFFYNKIGNTAFIGFSGAHTFASQQAYFEEACTWAQTSKPDVLLLLGHWNQAGDGCEQEGVVPTVYTEMTAMPSCAPLMSKTRYFMGHKHCNIITEPNVGFMVGAQGMSDASSCGGVFGLPIVDTTNGSFKVYYFPIAKANEYDNYDALLSCVKASGISGCYHLAEVWADVPF